MKLISIQKSRFLKIALLVALVAEPRFTLAESDAEFDRLDGTGQSGKKVDVIEWEGNLEIHVYPAGSLKGLALKLDKRNRDKPVMVIGYRFDRSPSKQLVRRAVLGIELSEPFKVYKDPSVDEYDKLVISNNGLASPLALFKLDPEPKQLYPDGHPMLAQGAGDPSKEARKPASRAAQKKEPVESEVNPDDGTIQPFFTSPEERNYFPGRRGL